jgi:hypothetical protein
MFFSDMTYVWSADWTCRRVVAVEGALSRIGSKMVSEVGHEGETEIFPHTKVTLTIENTISNQTTRVNALSVLTSQRLATAALQIIGRHDFPD